MVLKKKWKGKKEFIMDVFLLTEFHEKYFVRLVTWESF
jgi:hypothetical protein